ncbi:MAG: heme-binding protein [Candidatus Poseidonia sp.]|nr:heme-binding protein [Poseidonia sp.]MBL6748619.1 heme-binding protein [Poseidonia sp.]MBL6886879.1 heme-binding protein [Poseidonia sp.]MBL6893262.1 heme-binding protein [Poseidonia sp.]
MKKGGAELADQPEQPRFERLATYDGFEVRRYAPSIEARVKTAGLGGDSSSTGFRRIAGYIFGGNKEGHSIAMTAPVQQWGGEDDGWMSFTMPSSYTLTSLPEPMDKGVILFALEQRDVAVLSFSGRYHKKKCVRLNQHLHGLVEKAGLTAIAAPILAVYDGPMTLPFRRRNEILLPVNWSTEQ